MDSLVAEGFKYIFVALTIVFLLFVIGVGVRASYISDYRQDITQTIQRYGGLTNAAITKLNGDSKTYYDNSFTVDTANSDVGDAGYGDTVDYTVNVSIKAPFNINFLHTNASTVLFSGKMKGSAVSQVRKSTESSDVLDTSSTYDSNFADNYNSSNMNVANKDFNNASVDSSYQFESSNYMSVTAKSYLYTSAFFAQSEVGSKQNFQVAVYDSDKNLLGFAVPASLGSTLAGDSYSGTSSDYAVNSSLVLTGRNIYQLPSNAAYVRFGVTVNKQTNLVSSMGKTYSVYVAQETSSSTVPSYTSMPDVSWAMKNSSGYSNSFVNLATNASDSTKIDGAVGSSSTKDTYRILSNILENSSTKYGYSVYVGTMSSPTLDTSLSQVYLNYLTNSNSLLTLSGLDSAYKGTLTNTSYSAKMTNPTSNTLISGFNTTSDVFIPATMYGHVSLAACLSTGNSSYNLFVNPFATVSSAGQ